MTPEPGCVHRIATRPEQSQRDQVEKDDDRKGCTADTDSAPNEHMHEQADGGDNRRQIACEQRDRQQYAGRVYPAGRSGTAIDTLDKKRCRDGRP